MTDEERVEKYLKTVETTIYDFMCSKVERAYLAGLKEGRKEFEKENAKLKAEIEELKTHCRAVDAVNVKMKNCENCKNDVWHYLINSSCPCDECNNNSKWELKVK